jgi:hypothetical protein
MEHLYCKLPVYSPYIIINYTYNTIDSAFKNISKPVQAQIQGDQKWAHIGEQWEKFGKLKYVMKYLSIGDQLQQQLDTRNLNLDKIDIDDAKANALKDLESKDITKQVEAILYYRSITIDKVISCGYDETRHIAHIYNGKPEYNQNTEYMYAYYNKKIYYCGNDRKLYTRTYIDIIPVDANDSPQYWITLMEMKKHDYEKYDIILDNIIIAPTMRANPCIRYIYPTLDNYRQRDKDIMRYHINLGGKWELILYTTMYFINNANRPKNSFKLGIDNIMYPIYGSLNYMPCPDIDGYWLPLPIYEEIQRKKQIKRDENKKLLEKMRIMYNGKVARAKKITPIKETHVIDIKNMLFGSLREKSHIEIKNIDEFDYIKFSIKKSTLDKPRGGLYSIEIYGMTCFIALDQKLYYLKDSYLEHACWNAHMQYWICG